MNGINYLLIVYKLIVLIILKIRIDKYLVRAGYILCSAGVVWMASCYILSGR